MYGEGWVWIATDGATSLYVGDDSEVNLTTAGFVGVSPESMCKLFLLRYLFVKFNFQFIF